MKYKALNNDIEVYDYIIIGSGFGGSVSAMRLAEKGYKIVVLEKGSRFEAKDFPKTNWNFKRYLWMPALRWFGFLKLTFFKRLFVLSGVGVGGGSLVYANTLMEPTDPFYKHIPIQTKDWKKLLSPYFANAKYMLGATPAKDHYPDDFLLKEIARDMKRESSYKNVNVGVYYNENIKPVDPYFDGHGPLRTPCIECAGCMVGCRYNAKNTLDKNYLWFAEKAGAVIKAESEVIKIEYDSDLRYTVTVRNRTTKKIIHYHSKGLVVSGGVLGTLDLLFKQKYVYKTLPLLSDTLGQNILSNSESISGVIHTDQKLNQGVAISALMQADENTQVEWVKFPNGSGSLFRMAFIAAGRGSHLIRILKVIVNSLIHPINTIRWIIFGHKASHALVILVMQNLKNAMQMKWKGRKMILLNGKEDAPIPVFIPTGHEVLTRLAKKTNGIAVNALTETFLNMATTAHILGGCPMGDNNSNSVVNEYFKVHSYPDMYILDGSIVPANIGVNPSLTITALAEYAVDQINLKL